MKRREVAEQLLAAFAEELEQLGVEVPARRYVAPGQAIVWDGEQLTVNLQMAGQGQPGAPYTGTYVPGTQVMYAQWSVNLVREVPGLSGDGVLQAQLPPETELNESGLAGMDDAEALEKAAAAIHAKYVVTGPGMGFAVGPVQPLGPEGGLAGVRILIDAAVH